MKIFVIQGPTASGKSVLAMDMAHAFDGCIINADSMQLYRGLPILSAQPTDEDTKRIPHRLYSIFDPSVQCSASDWNRRAQQIMAEEKDKFKSFILVGGTGFYIKALVEGLSPIPPIPLTQRQGLQEILRGQGTEGLYALLQEKDSVMAARLVPQDTQRIMRALEVVLFTHKSLALWQQEIKQDPLENRPLFINILPPRNLLYEGINERVIKMVKQGVVEEVAALWKQHLFSIGCTKTLGYREIVNYLEGRFSLQEALEKTQQKSRNYAKRQLTWLRHQTVANIVWPTIYTPTQWEEFTNYIGKTLL